MVNFIFKKDAIVISSNNIQFLFTELSFVLPLIVVVVVFIFIFVFIVMIEKELFFFNDVLSN